MSQVDIVTEQIIEGTPKREMVPYDGPTEFVHHHNHTIYSMLDGVSSPAELFKVTKERGWKALTITEHGHLASMPDNYIEAEANGIKAIVGSEIYYNDKEPLRQEMHQKLDEATAAKNKDNIAKYKLANLKLSENPEDRDLHNRIVRNRHLTVLAKNPKGVENLIKLTTQAYKTGFYYKPRIWFEKLAEHREGLVVLSGCLNGPVSFELRHKRLEAAENYVKRFIDVFGGDYYIELQMPCLVHDPESGTIPDYAVFWMLCSLAKKYNLKTILANDSHYISRIGFDTQRLMMAIDQGMTEDSKDLFHVNSSEQFYKTRAELWHTFKTNKYSQRVTDAEFHAMCDNTILLAQECQHNKPDKSPKIPHLQNENEALRKIVAGELISRGLHKDKTKYIWSIIIWLRILSKPK